MELKRHKVAANQEARFANCGSVGGGQTLFSSKDRDIGVTDRLKLDLQSIRSLQRTAHPKD